MIANIASHDALILPHRANPAGLNFRERQGDIGHLAENLAAQSMTDLAERGSLGVR